LHSGFGYAERVQPRHGILSTQFHDLQLPNNRIPFRRLAQPEQTVGDGKDRIIPYLFLRIFTDQKRCCLPTGQEQG
jgi:hypothetical protein